MRHFTLTERGDHTENEDFFLAAPHPDDPASRLVFLADGVGGRRGGARAARLGCESGFERAKSLPPGQLGLTSTWVSLFREVDRILHADAEAGFTTLVGFAVVGKNVCGASCGDSALLLKNGDGDRVELTAGQGKNPPFGSSAARGVPFGCELSGKWSLLAMTDGVWKYGGWDRIAAAMRETSGEELLHRLREAARLPGSGKFPDDFTAVLLESGDGSLASASG